MSARGIETSISFLGDIWIHLFLMGYRNHITVSVVVQAFGFLDKPRNSERNTDCGVVRVIREGSGQVRGVSLLAVDLNQRKDGFTRIPECRVNFVDGQRNSGRAFTSALDLDES